VDGSFDIAASLFLVSSVTFVLAAHLVTSLAAGRELTSPRVMREAALPLVGKAPMHAVYRALGPIARVLVALGASPNGVSLSALVIACVDAVAFGHGNFGIAAVIASIASLADGLDGFVARETGKVSRFGQVLDTMIDRYVDALFLGGIALYVRHEAALLVVTLAAIVGSFMVSYASSVERELGGAALPGAMRRAHRLAYLIVASTAAPIVGAVFDDPREGLIPVFMAVGAVAIIGNVSAVRRLLAAGRAATIREAEVASGPDLEAEAESRVGGARR
jgi:phosphatidylglycerophosphate synthase